MIEVMNDDKRRGLLKATVLAGIGLAMPACGNRHFDPIFAERCTAITCPPPEQVAAKQELEKPVVCTIDPAVLDAAPGEASRLSVSPDGSHLYVHLMSSSTTYRLNVGPGCNLTLDTTFAEAGLLRGDVASVYETASGIFLDNGRNLTPLGGEKACAVQPFRYAITDEGDVGFAVSRLETDPKAVRKLTPAGCTVHETDTNAATLREAPHVAVGVGPKGSILFANQPLDQATMLESYNPAANKVTVAYTLGESANVKNFVLTALRDCDGDVCALGFNKGGHAFYRFDGSGKVVREMTPSLDSTLPIEVRNEMVLKEATGAIARGGIAFVPYVSGGKLGIVRLSLNYAPATSADASTDAPIEGAAHDANSSDAASDATNDATDAGTD